MLERFKYSKNVIFSSGFRRRINTTYYQVTHYANIKRGDLNGREKRAIRKRSHIVKIEVKMKKNGKKRQEMSRQQIL